MLDPKQFWAQPPGARPGETNAQLDQVQAMYQQYAQIMGTDAPAPTPDQAEALRQVISAAMAGGAGVTQAQIVAWEKKHRVKFPKLLSEVFQQQDGGMVRDADVYISVLNAIQPIDDDDFYEEEFKDLRLVFEFAHDGGEGRYLLDYNARGRNAEPAVYLEFRDSGDLDKSAESVDELFQELLKSSDEPEVNWSETERLIVVAREQLDMTAHYHGVPASLDQVLCRDGRALILFVQRRTGDDQTLTRTVLPEPLSTEIGLGAGSVQPIQPGRTDIWTLQLQPRNSDGIVQVESTRTSTGQWKNRTTHGVPIYDSIWCADRNRLKQLRVELLGKKEADRVQEEDDARQELQDKMLALPPEVQHAAFMDMFQKGWAENERLFANLGEPPPEIAGLMDALQGKLNEAMRRAQDEAAKHPLDPEIRKLIEKTTKRPPPAVDD
jgi:SMI1 / KNR4 family (SUKH-1)